MVQALGYENGQYTGGPKIIPTVVEFWMVGLLENEPSLYHLAKRFTELADYSVYRSHYPDIKIIGRLLTELEAEKFRGESAFLMGVRETATELISLPVANYEVHRFRSRQMISAARKRREELRGHDVILFKVIHQDGSSSFALSFRQETGEAAISLKADYRPLFNCFGISNGRRGHEIIFRSNSALKTPFPAGYDEIQAWIEDQIRSENWTAFPLPASEP